MNPTGKQQDEARLVAGLKGREEQVLAEVYDRYSPTLYGIVLRIVQSEEIAQDIIQEAFVRIWRKIDSYDAARGRLFTWMLNISRNLALDFLRSKENKMRSMVQPLENSVNTIDSTRSGQQSIDHIGLKAILKNLKPESQAIIEILYFKGYTQAEAAKELDLPLGTVKSRLRIALRDLRKLTSDSGH